MRILVVSAVIMLGATSAQAQFGNLVNKVKMAKQTAEDVKKKVDMATSSSPRVAT